MKKRLLNLVVLAVISLAAFAQTDYGISVGGVRVTSENAENIVGTAIKGGTVTYAEGTLTVKNAIIECNAEDNAPSVPAIENSDNQGLTIKFEGKSTLTSIGGKCILIGKNTTIEGEVVRLNGQDGIVLSNNVRLTMNSIDCTISCTGTGIRAAADNGGGTTLKLNSARIDIVDATTAIGPIQNCTAEGCDVRTPAYTCYRKALLGFAAQGESQLVSTLTVEPLTGSSASNFPVSICGKWLNSFNALTFAVEGLKSGTINYDASKSILTLNDVDMDVTLQNCILSISEGLTIRFTGSHNKLRSVSSPAIYLMGNAVIQLAPDAGDVDIQSAGSNIECIRLMGTERLTFDGQDNADGAQLNISAERGISFKGVQSDYFSQKTIIRFIRSPKVSINAQNIAVYGSNCQLQLDNSCAFTGQHAPFAYDENSNSLADCKTGLPIKQLSVQPATYYGMRIYGFDVTSGNASNILGDGTLSYSSVNNTLTMNGMKADWSQLGDVSFLEYTSTSPLNIFLKGKNTISWGDIQLSANATMSASSHVSGSLTLLGCSAITRSLEVKNCHLELTDGKGDAIASLKGTDLPVLTIGEGVDATFHSHALNDYGDIKLQDGAFFYNPKDVTFDKWQKRFVQNGKDYDGKIRITGQWKVADVNNDDRLTAADILCVTDFISGNKTKKTEEVDINGDGKVNVADIVIIAKGMAKGE